jgi:DNA polymerase
MFGSSFSIARERGHWRGLDTHLEGFATWHPSAVLRAADERREQP